MFLLNLLSFPVPLSELNPNNPTLYVRIHHIYNGPDRENNITIPFRDRDKAIFGSEKSRLIKVGGSLKKGV
jgi:hypothetical protein